MERISFIFTICFMLLGPIKIIQPFARLTQGKDRPFKRSVAIKSALIAAIVCIFVVIAGDNLVNKYELSFAALQISGGLVLLLAAMLTIFPRAEPEADTAEDRSTLQVALGFATPVIVPPAGVAAILIFVGFAAKYPGMYQALAVVLAIILVLDLIVMFFNDQIMRIPVLLPAIQLLGAILIFIQVALAIDTILSAIKLLGIIPAGAS